MNQRDVKKKSDKLSVLIVDDISENIKILANILSKEGFLVAASKNGQHTLSVVKKIKPDLILLDVMMPGIDGYEVCKRLKASDETREIPVIFLTAKTETENIVEGFSYGAVDYVTKPFNATVLLSRVKTHLELKKTRDNQKKIIKKLKDALHEVKILSGMLPICSSCKNIRDDQGYWKRIEAYISARSEVEFSHSICPKCAKELYPELDFEE